MSTSITQIEGKFIVSLSTPHGVMEAKVFDTLEEAKQYERKESGHIN